MADLDGLRQRVEQIDLRLKTAHRAREKESVALMDMWEQIRERFREQNAEIVELRNRVADLEDTRNDLLQMVHGLLSAVEGGLERMSDETVPRIREMACSLLEADKTSLPPTSSADSGRPAEADYDALPEVLERQTEEDPVPPYFHDELLAAIEQSIESVRGNGAVDEASEITERNARMHGTNGPASPGIRDLVARIENAVGPELLETTSENDDEDFPEDDLSRDLREIEALRGELNGLRERISSGR